MKSTLTAAQKKQIDAQYAKEAAERVAFDAEMNRARHEGCTCDTSFTGFACRSCVGA